MRDDQKARLGEVALFALDAAPDAAAEVTD
jgi:hypothetical protein